VRVVQGLGEGRQRKGRADPLQGRRGQKRISTLGKEEKEKPVFDWRVKRGGESPRLGPGTLIVSNEMGNADQVKVSSVNDFSKTAKGKKNIKKNAQVGRRGNFQGARGKIVCLSNICTNSARGGDQKKTTSPLSESGGVTRSKRSKSRGGKDTPVLDWWGPWGDGETGRPPSILGLANRKKKRKVNRKEGVVGEEESTRRRNHGQRERLSRRG